MKCLNCNNTFIPSRFHLQKYCCVHCRETHWRINNPEKIILARTKFRLANKDKLIEYHRKYRIEHKKLLNERHKLNEKKWRRLRTPEYVARTAIKQAVRRKLIPKARELLCQKCGKKAKEYHHADYTKQLEVIPVCKKCHIKIGEIDKWKKRK